MSMIKRAKITDTSTDTISLKDRSSVGITNKKPRKNYERNLQYFLRAITTNNNDPDSFFFEVKDTESKKRLSRLKRKIYAKNHINLNPLTSYSSVKNNGIGTDYFDRPEIARFFFQYRFPDCRDYPKVFFKSYTAISRNNPLNMLPSEPCTLDQLSLDQLSEKIGHLTPAYQTSSLPDNEADRFYRFLEENDPAKTFEIGGFFGTDPCPAKNLVMLYNIGKIAYQENWEAVIQTVHPDQARFYEQCTPYPYHRLTQNPYHDHLNRPAITLFLKRDEFREYFENIEKRLKEIL